MHTVFADTGGVSAEERDYIEERARELGVASHRTVDASQAIWDSFVKPLIQAGEFYQGQYPLLVSDRYVIVEESLKRCDELGTRSFAHGCTGMGNDQVRFDLAVKALGDYEIVAPIREIQKEHTEVRAYEQKYLEAARLRRAREDQALHDQRERARRDDLRRRDRPLAGAGRRRRRLVRAARRVAGRAAARRDRIRATARRSRSTASGSPAARSSSG